MAVDADAYQQRGVRVGVGGFVPFATPPAKASARSDDFVFDTRFVVGLKDAISRGRPSKVIRVIRLQRGRRPRMIFARIIVFKGGFYWLSCRLLTTRRSRGRIRVGLKRRCKGGVVACATSPIESSALSTRSLELTLDFCPRDDTHNVLCARWS